MTPRRAPGECSRRACCAVGSCCGGAHGGRGRSCQGAEDGARGHAARRAGTQEARGQQTASAAQQGAAAALLQELRVRSHVNCALCAYAALASAVTAHRRACSIALRQRVVISTSARRHVRVRAVGPPWQTLLTEFCDASLTRAPGGSPPGAARGRGGRTGGVSAGEGAGSFAALASQVALLNNTTLASTEYLPASPLVQRPASPVLRRKPARGRREARLPGAGH